MAQHIGTLNIKKIDTLFVTVKITKEFKVRSFIAIKLFKLAGFIIGGNVEVETEIK